MPNFAKPLMIAAALTGAAAPALAAAPANPAAALSVAKSVRTPAAVRHDPKLAGIGTGTITFAIIGGIVILAAVLVATNDTPDSV